MESNYDSDEESLKMEITDLDSNTMTLRKYIYILPKHYNQNHNKRLICYSIVNEEPCKYGQKCSYAHDENEQIIDEERKQIFQIILDKNLLDFNTITRSKKNILYKDLLIVTKLCNKCLRHKCTGGYNCKFGICSLSLKLCKCDLLVGDCKNPIVDINIEEDILKKIGGITPLDRYIGCMNGHHLTARGLLPYYKYNHMENNRMGTLEKSFSLKLEDYLNDNSYSFTNSDDSYDDEISQIFKKETY